MRISIIKNRLLVGCLFLAAGNALSASARDEVRIWTEYDTVGMIGDALQLKLCCEGPQVESVQFPFLQGAFSEGLEILPADSLDSRIETTASGMLKRTDTYRFSAYKEGLYHIPPFRFEYPLKDSLRTVTTDSAAVRFFAPVVDTTAAIKDIRPILDISGKELWAEYFDLYGRWLWILLALAAAVMLFFYFRKKRKKILPFFAPAPVPVDPLKKAIAALKALKEKELWQKNLTKEYYTELTDIFREYLAGQMGIPAIEMTNEELCAALPQALHETPELVPSLIQVLDLAALAKFAKGSPLPSDNETSYARMAEFFAERQKLKELLDEKKKNADAAAARESGEDDKDAAGTETSGTEKEAPGK